MVKRTHNGQVTTFKWDAANRMIESISREIQTVYLYDALGRRIVKHSQPIVPTVGEAGSDYVAIQKQKLSQQHNLGLTLYGWDGDTLAWESTYGNRSQINEVTGQLEAARDTSRTTHYIYEPNTFVPMMQAVKQGSINLLPTPDDAAMTASPEGYDIDRDPVWYYQPENHVQPFDQIAFYQCDHLGTPQELTDMHGKAVWTAQYKAWGAAKAAMSDAAKRAGFTNPIRFQGQYFDHETGLHYNRHRYYDPHSGRFVSRDPIGLYGGYNLHSYAANPTGWVDSLGLNPNKPRRANGQYAPNPKTAGGSTCQRCCDKLNRPYIRAATRAAVEAAAKKTPEGLFRDANTLKPITGKYDLGHKRGHEFWREKQNAEAKCMTQSNFNDYMNNSNFYRIEDPSSNRSHRYEDKSP